MKRALLLLGAAVLLAACGSDNSSSSSVVTTTATTRAATSTTTTSGASSGSATSGPSGTSGRNVDRRGAGPMMRFAISPCVVGDVNGSEPHSISNRMIPIA